MEWGKVSKKISILSLCEEINFLKLSLKTASFFMSTGEIGEKKSNFHISIESNS